MKNLKIVIICVTFLLCIYSFTTLPKSSGNIGDVKYSVLNPTDFIKANGSGWALMEGQHIDGTTGNLQKAELNKEFPTVTKLPDTRGVFIRCQNLNQNKTLGDPDGERDITKLQMDMFAKHSHTIQTVNGNTDMGNGVLNSNANGHRSKSASDSVGGPETRPKNIALYIYVKIND